MPYKPKGKIPNWVPPKRKPHANSGEKSQAFYNSHSWRKFRKAYLSRNPICVKCELENKIKPAVYLDHIRRIKSGGEKFDENNLQGLCKFHHDSKSGKEGHGYEETK